MKRTPQNTQEAPFQKYLEKNRPKILLLPFFFLQNLRLKQTTPEHEPGCSNKDIFHIVIRTLPEQ